ncbi:MAG: RNA methyltransferase [Oscillospiraceae bacterium]|jgi:TrmH family RNA methyltransferase|nr:RNA methyltransferase [Oscillospiraceae bacterium]
MEQITSMQNPLLQHVRKLLSVRSYREACREFAAEGWKLLHEALQWQGQITTVLLTNDAQCPPLPDSVRLVRLPQGLMDRLSPMKSPQGVIFVCKMPQEIQPQLRAGMLLLDRIQDPGNLGTILRTADAFDIRVLLTNDCADPYSEKTLRASMGAIFRTPPQSLPWAQILALCKEKQIPIAATALSAQARDIRSVDLRQALVVIGSEGQGICKEILEQAQTHIIIPMQPRCESLNAAAAASIVLWQMRE